MVKRILRDIPEASLAQVVKDFESEGCTIAKKEKQPDGRWTIEAACPDEAAKEQKSPRMVKRILRDIPEASLAQVVKDLISEGCTIVKKEKQPDGRWTIEAACPAKRV